MAEDAQQKFPLFGVPCTAPIDAHQQFIAASMSRPTSALVAISNTGRTRSVIDCAKVARANGATVVGISGARTPLLEHCDVGLVVESLEDTDFYTPTTSRLAQLVVIDILATGVALRQGPDEIERMRTMKEQLTAMRTGHHPEYFLGTAEADAEETAPGDADAAARDTEHASDQEPPTT